MARRTRGIEQTEAQCMKDPSFMGPTVGHNGVGG